VIPKAPSNKRAAGVRAGLLLAFVLYAFFAPAQLGGRVSYVTTFGVSMQPQIHAGDLAVVRRASGYHVGDVVAYRSSMLGGGIVLHRIIAIRNGLYSFKGDNNDYVDPSPVPRSALVGRMWLHVPRAGAALGWLRSNLPLVVFALVVALGAGAGERRRRRRRRGDSPSAPWTLKLPLPVVGAATRSSLLKPCLGLVGVGVLLAVAVFSRPTSRAATRSVPYKQSGVFAYSAPTRDGSVYGRGAAATGEPVFTRLSDGVRFSFAYRLTGALPLRAAGSADLAVTLSDATGWHRTLELQDWRRFTGGRVSLGGTLSLDAVRGIVERLDTATGVQHTPIVVKVTPRVAVAGSVAGAALHTSFKPVLGLVLTADQLQMQQTSSPDGSAAADATHPRALGSLQLAARTPATMKVLRLEARVVVWRRLALALVGVGLAGLALLAALRRAEAEQDEAEQIASRYRAWLVPVAALDRAAYPQVVEVADMAALVRVAETYERMILHERSPAGDAYFVIDDGVVHAYRIGDVALEPEAPPTPPLPRAVPEIEPAKGHLGVVRSVS
jgi:signal peptidase I